MDMLVQVSSHPAADLRDLLLLKCRHSGSKSHKVCVIDIVQVLLIKQCLTITALATVIVSG